jgi:cupin fold WbuC family metalloprotein
MQIIDNNLLVSLAKEAQGNIRKRKNYNFHKENADTLQRMLNAIEPGSYVQPHRHLSPAKREMFIILTGKMLVVIFDDRGNIIQSAVLDSTGDNKGVEILPHQWHTIISLLPGSIVFEVKDGPYNPDDDKGFAPWAPSPESPQAAGYLDKLISQCIR